jgi:hypothetical protein
MQTRGTSSAGRPFWRRASRSKAAGWNTDGADVFFFPRIEGMGFGLAGKHE